MATGKPVTADNLHITLQFLGNVTAAQQTQLETGAASCPIEPFTLLLDSLGHFAGSRVLWLGASLSPEPLQRLAACLGEQMRHCGLSPDSRPYHPHLTLRRKVSKPPNPDFTFPAFPWTIDTFALVRSHTLPTGVQYQVLRQWGPGEATLSSATPADES